MYAELSHREAKSLFGPWVDEELEAPQAQRLRAHLDDCADCRTGWQRYERVVKSTRALDKERAPEGLASIIARRVRRRRFGSRMMQLSSVHYGLPAEVIIPIILAVSVAALLFLLR